MTELRLLSDFHGREYKARILIKSDSNLLVSGNTASGFLNHALLHRYKKKTSETYWLTRRRAAAPSTAALKFLPIR
jgi:hypothetical protein